MKELIRRKLFVINLLFLVVAPFLILGELGQIEIRAIVEPNFVSLNSSSTNIDENGTDALSNESQSDEKMQIQICDASHPC
ncbi:MAG: hypothetical protein ACRD8Z_25415 [Nitrososphaeraceae archaeon]